jgi:triosephosphate isomerase
MNLTYGQGEQLIRDVLAAGIRPASHQQVLFALPFPYLMPMAPLLKGKEGYLIAAQNCHHRKSGAYTGEVSAEMLESIGIPYCLVGHSERREYFRESHQELAEKVNRCLDSGIRPLFCCGEPLPVREEGGQNTYVERQLKESIFHLSSEAFSRLVIAYEPIWAIGTGKTASTEQAQEMHAYLRRVIAGQYGPALSERISLLYGGSVKAGNARELFASPDVDGGLVGGASLVAADFIRIIQSLD